MASTPLGEPRVGRVRLRGVAVAFGVLRVLGAGAEGWLRWRAAVAREGPPHPDRSLEDEWEWATRHLVSQRTRLDGQAEFDPWLGWITRPNLSESGTTSNSVGMRGGREYPLERIAGYRRLLLVGDSYVFGANTDDDHVFHEVLRRDHLVDWEVLNLGVSGYGPDQALLRFERDGRPYRPDVAVMGFYVRGFFRNSKRFRGYAKPWFEMPEGKLELRGVPVPSPEELYDEYASGRRRVGSRVYSYLLGTIGARIARARERMFVDPGGRDWAVMSAILERFRDRAVEMGARPILLIIPQRLERHRGSVCEQVERLAVKEAETLGLEYVNLVNAFEQELRVRPEPPMYRPRSDGGHFSARGNHAVAACLADLLRP